MRRLLPRRPLVPALVLIVLGALLLPWTSGVAILLNSYWPVPIIFAGVIQLLMVAAGKAREGYLFSGFLLVLGGIGTLAIVRGFAHMELSKGWPGFVTLTGLVLVFLGFVQPEAKRPSYRVPGIAFVLISGVFFLFSFDLISTSFADFVASWWPVILVLLGLSFLIPRRSQDLEGFGDDDPIS